MSEVQKLSWWLRAAPTFNYYFFVYMNSLRRIARTSLAIPCVGHSSAFCSERAFPLAGCVLAERDREPGDVLAHAERFLQRLVRDNAINYPQDRETLMWSAGYYLHNACFRLEVIVAKVLSDPRPPRSWTNRKRLTFEDFIGCWKGLTDPKAQWHRAFEIATEAHGVLSRIARDDSPAGGIPEGRQTST